MCFEIASLVAAVRSGALQRVAIIYWPVLRKPLRSETLTFTQGDGCRTRAQGVRGDGPPLRGVGLLFISGECSVEERYKEERAHARWYGKSDQSADRRNSCSRAYHHLAAVTLRTSPQPVCACLWTGVARSAWGRRMAS